MKIILNIGIALFMISSCRKVERDNKPVIPDVLVNINDSLISRNQGIVYYKKQAFFGYLVDRSASLDRAGKDKLIFKEGYFQGKQEGESWRWYENGQMAERRYYRDNRKEGRHTGWWDNGQVRFDYYFQKDIPVQHHRDWYQNGQLFTSFHYNSEGHEEGSQQMWFATGQVKANYVVKDGRRFGLIGAKGCMGENERKTFTVLKSKDKNDNKR